MTFKGRYPMSISAKLQEVIFTVHFAAKAESLVDTLTYMGYPCNVEVESVADYHVVAKIPIDSMPWSLIKSYPIQIVS